MKIGYRFIVILVCLLFSVLAAHAATLDSLRLLLRTQKEDTSKVALLLLMADKTGNFNDRETYIRQAESLSEALMSSTLPPRVRARATIQLAETYYKHSVLYRQRGNLAARVEYCRKALDLYLRTGDSVLISKAHNFLGITLISVGKYEEAKQQLSQGLRIARLSNNINQHATSYQGFGDLSRAQGRYAEALQYYEHALQLRKEDITRALAQHLDTVVSDNKLKKTDIYNAICGMYRSVEDYDKALEYAQQSMAIYTELRDSVRMFSVYLVAGDIYYSKQQYDSALAYFKNAMLLAEVNTNKWAISTICERQGFVYLSLKNYPTALRLQLRGLELAIEIGDIKGIADSYEDVARVYLGMGAEKPVYYDSAEVYARKALREYIELRNESSTAQEHMTLATIYQFKKKYAVQKHHLLQALTIFTAGGSKQYLWECYNSLATCDSSLGNPTEAYLYLRRSMNYQDSLNREKNDLNFKRVQFQNELKKMEADLAKEQERKDAASRMELAEQKTMRNGFIAGFMILLLFSGIVYRQRNRVKNEKTNVEREKKRSDELLLNILPANVAEELKSKGTADAKHFSDVTVLFTDFISFTTVSEQLSPQELVDELHACFKGFDEICSKHNIEKIKTIGDAYLAVCGLPQADEHHAEHVVHAALEIREFMKKRREKLGAKTFEIRIGINSGSVVAGIVGVKKFAYDIWGDTVNTAARMEQSSEPGKINISETTYALVKDKFQCEFRGEIDAKNKGKLAMYFVEV
ncbi:MAG: adenylate/guanylate cyclase domain-containing protein [Candidatus Kapaibacterium sp.]